MKRTLMVVLLALFGAGCLYAQKVTGRVTSREDGNPIAFATVVVKGFSTVANTNNNGEYAIDLPKGGNILSFSFFGMVTQDVTVSGRTVIDVVLEPDAQTLDETVVIGYGSVKRSDITGAVSSVNIGDINNQPVVAIDQALQGRLAGVQVTSNSGSPGGTVSVRIRGVGTVNDSDPLYVVDGMPVSNIQYLNPSDITAMEVLKDASATAIYGSRGANGVIMITTRKGASGKSVVTFDGYTGWQTMLNNLELLSGSEWYDIQTEINKTRKNPIDLGLVDRNISTDWMKEISKQNAFMQSYNLSITGGADDYKYAISGGYFKQQGTLKGSNFERVTFRINTEKTVFKPFVLGTNIGLSNASKDYILEGSNTVGIVNTAIKLEPVIPVRNADGSWGYSPFIDYPNPVAAIHYSNNQEDKLSLVGNIYGVFELYEGLKFKSNFGLDVSKIQGREFVPVYEVSVSQKNVESSNNSIRNSDVSWVWENTLTYDKTFNDIHALTVLAGYTAEENITNQLWALGKGMPSNSPNFWYVGAGLNPAKSAGEVQWESALISYLGRVNYSLMDRYLLTASVRVDGSSRFAKENRFATFPSLALGWKLSNENFMKNLNAGWLTSLKLRFGWGIIGNQNIGNYKFQNVMTSGAQYRYIFGLDEKLYQGTVAVVMGNDQIKWEQTESTNVGLDLSLFKGRFGLAFDYYVKTTKDMLLTEPIPYYFGFETGPVTNVGSVRNKGIEIVVSWRDEAFKDFFYNISANLSTVKNEVLSLGTGQALSGGAIRNGSATRTQVGGPIGAFYGYKTDGLIQTAEQLAEVRKLQPNAELGDVIFRNLVNDGKLDDKDKTIIGSPIPDFIYGFNLGFDYKGFDAMVFFQGTQGNDIFNAMRYFTYDFSDVTNKDRAVLNHWTPNNTNTNIPRLNGDDMNENNRISDRYVEDGSYLRLRNIQLGYTLSPEWTRKAGIDKLRVFVSGQNIFTITNYTGADPEVGQISSTNYLSKGVDIGTYPQAKVWTVGVNLTF